MLKPVLKALLLCSGACLFSGVAHAQDAGKASPQTGDDAIPDIIITANKRTESVQKVPASVAVVSGEDLAKMNVQSVQDLDKAVPGFLFKGGYNPTNSSLTIRGISTFSYSRSIEPSVGTVVDGVVMGLQGPNLFNFDDVARVEVLRGPQGTLFGMNSSAGVLNIVTKDPTDRFSGNLSAGYGTYNAFNGSAALSGPIVGDKLLLRVSGFYNRRDPYVQNVFTNTAVNGDEQKGARFKLLFKPNSNTRISLTGDAEWDNSTCCAPVFVNFVPGRSTALDHQFYDPIVGIPNANNLPGGVFSRSRGKGLALQWDQQLGGGFTLTSISGYRDYFIGAEVTIVQPSLILASNYGVSTQRQFSQEIRLASPVGGKIDYVVGAFFFDQHKGGSIDQRINPRGSAFQQQLHLDFHNADNTNYALFGEANIRPTSTLTLIAGARWTAEDVFFKNIGLPHDPAYTLVNLGPGATLSDKTSMRKWSWRLGAKWQFLPSSMLYATVSRGIKGPAFNTLATPATGSQKVIPEIATSYEAGFKGSFWGNRVRTSLSVFNTNFNNFQAQGLYTDPVTGIRTFILINAGKLRTRGVEWSLDAAPTNNLNLKANLAYIDGRFQQFTAQCWTGQTAAQGCVGGNQNLRNARLPSTPRWAWSVSADDRVPLAGAPFDGFVRVDFNWRGTVQWDIYQDPAAIEGPHGSLGASLGIRDKKGAYTFSIFAKNITNDFYTQSLTPGTAIVGFIPPDYKRTIGAKLDLSF